MTKTHRIKCMAILTTIIYSMAVPYIMAVTTTWDGSDGNWNDAHWDNGVPQAGYDVIINSGTVTLSNATPVLASYTQGGGTLSFTNWTTKLEAETVTLNAGIMQPAAAFTNNVMSNRVWIVCKDLTIDDGAEINADGLGYDGVWAADGQGPGKSLVSQYRTGGAGHGGDGGTGSDRGSYGEAYGDAIYPVAPGSSSAGRTQTTHERFGNPGGGAIRIDATGDVTIDGLISANGVGNILYIGGGSGGSILIQCNTMSGSGTLSADGGAARTGGGEGGGGRIAVHYNTAAQASMPALTISAAAGKRDHHTESQFGSIYFSDTLVLTEAVSNLRGWLHIPNFDSWSTTSLTLTNSYLGFLAEDFDLSVAGDMNGSGDRMLAFASNATVNVGGNLATSIAFEQGGSCTVDGNILLPATTMNNYHSLTFETDITATGNLTLESTWRNTSAPTNGIKSHGALISAESDMSIGASGILYLYSNPTNGGSALLQMDNLLIAEEGMINADGGGFGSAINIDGYGPGGGVRHSTRAGGGGFGGKGGVGNTLISPNGAAGLTNGQNFAVLWPGSGGGGRSNQTGDFGGGLVQIEAGSAVNVYGTITANGFGTKSYGGSGSGGGIFIRTKTFEGGENSVLQANGGNRGSQGGGAGGGGRIVVWYGEIDEVDAAKILAGNYTEIGSRFVATTTMTGFEGIATASKGDQGTGSDQGQEDGTVFFVTVLPPQGTLILIQ